jgi:hypothetical protein
VKCNLQRRLQRAQPKGGFDAVEAGHHEIQHGDVQAPRTGELDRLRAVLRLDNRRDAGACPQ